jgi:WD40 repeat protein
VSPDGQTLALTTFGAPLELWEQRTGRKLRTLRPGGSDNDVRSVAFSPDSNTLAAAGYDKAVTIWDVKTGALRRTLAGHTETVNVVAFAPNGHIIASGADDKTVRLWGARTGRLIRALAPLPYQVHGLAFSPNSGTVSASDRAGNIRRWNVPAAGQAFGDIAAPPANDVSERMMNYPVAFSPDGKQAARGDGDGKIRLFDLETGTLRHTLPGHHEGAHGIAFSPDGRLLATTGNNGKHELFTGGNQNDLRFWSTQTGKLLAKSGSGRYTHPTFDPDGDTLITGDSGGELLLWDVRALRPAAAHP